MLGYIKNNRTKKYNSFKRKKKHKNSKMCQEGKKHLNCDCYTVLSLHFQWRHFLVSISSLPI